MPEETEKKTRKSLLQKIGAHLLDFGEWMLDKLFLDPHQRALNALVDDLGLTLDKVPKFPTELSLDQIKAYVDADNPSLEAWIGAISDVRKLIESVQAIVDAVKLDDAGATSDEILQSVIDLLASNYVRDRWFHLFVWMELVRFSTEPMTLYGPHGTASRRFYGSLKALLRFALGPLAALGEHPLQTEAEARKLSDQTLLHLAAVFAFIGHSAREIGLDAAPEDEHVLRMFYGWDQPAGALSAGQLAAPIADRISERMLSVQLRAPPKAFQKKEITVEGALRFSLAWVPAEHGGPGLFVSVGGSSFRFNVDRRNAGWVAQAEARFDAPFGIQLGGEKDNLRIDSALTEGELHADVSIASRPVPPGVRPFSLSLGGSGLDIGRIALSATLDRDAARAQIAFYDCRLALDGTSFDGFIGSLLPKTQTSVEFSVGTGVGTREGWFATGDLSTPSGTGGTAAARQRRGGRPRTSTARAEMAGSTSRSVEPVALVPPDLPVNSTGLKGTGLPIQIPIGKSVGPVRLNHVLLNLDRDRSGESPKVLVQAAFSFSAQIGPVLAAVDRVGIRLALDFPDDRSKANLHFANLDVGFLAPAGIGLAVDAKSVRGGGFLFHDEAKQQYAGVMELSLSGVIALKAIGLLATRLPDGSRGYSLLILVTGQTARPGGSLLQLPLGWRLTGLGGLMAIHRTVDEDAVRAGLKNHTLEAILFPKDPVRNAPTVIAALDRVFPARRGSYLLGLMVQLQWGLPTLIEVNLGLILELGGRNRFVVLGRMTAILPRMDNDLLRLNLDAAGIFDFDQGTVAIDALLVDSRLLRRFPLTGAGALRARWTSPRSFALAVGGMHHGFTPPAGFPTLERIALSLTTGDNPRLTCDAYFALTSNTVQFGAHAYLYAAAYGFSVTGEAGFDVLIQLLPFHFLAEFFAGMQLRKGSRNLFKVKVEGALEGPLPLSVRAKCTFEVLWWDVSIRVNATLVSGAAPPMAVAVDASAQLRAALSDPKSWNAELPAGQTRVVSLRESAVDGVLRMHPLGTLTVRQSVVPLNLERDIDKFGEAPVAGARRFKVTRVVVGAGEQTANAVQDDFAPAQFFDMSDEAKLASPSFESMQAGLSIGSPQFAFGFSQRVESPLEYETRIIDRKAAVAPPPPARDYLLSEALLEMHALHGAAGRSRLRRERPAPAQPFARVDPVRWTAVGEDFALLAETKRQVSFVEALSSASLGRRRMVVREFELAGRPQ
jgi:hypothetical protein